MQKYGVLYLVYRWSFRVVTGSDCRAMFTEMFSNRWAKSAACLAGSAITATTSWGQINLPPPPQAAPPPVIPRELDPVIIRQEEKKVENENRLTEERADLQHKADLRQEELAKEEAKKPRPLYGFMELSMLYPKVTTSGNRRGYHADITTHACLWLRLLADRPPETTQIWAGMRLAPFSGYGIQAGERGRFGYTFFGPGIGIGKVSSIEDEASDSPSRSGWLVTGGVAAVSKQGVREEIPTKAASDFQTQSFGFESPGAWFELRYLRVFKGALGMNLLLGTQLADRKNFSYLGFGLAGWL